MYAILNRGTYSLTLAGGLGPSSETSGLSISGQPQFQQVQYVDSDQGAQFFRGGTMQSVSFSCVLTFPTLQAAEDYVLTTQQGILDQQGQTVTLGKIATTGTLQVETLACVGTTTGASNINWSLVAADLGMITGTTAVLLGDTPTQYALKIANSLNTNARIRARYTVTQSGANVILTKIMAEANDSTLALTTTNGSPSPGITGATSANTTAGAAPTFSNAITLTNASVILQLAYNGCSVTQQVNILGRYQ